MHCAMRTGKIECKRNLRLRTCLSSNGYSAAPSADFDFERNSNGWRQLRWKIKTIHWESTKGNLVSHDRFHSGTPMKTKWKQMILLRVKLHVGRLAAMPRTSAHCYVNTMHKSCGTIHHDLHKYLPIYLAWIVINGCMLFLPALVCFLLCNNKNRKADIVWFHRVILFAVRPIRFAPH